jgi:periplasmic protein TonB
MFDPFLHSLSGSDSKTDSAPTESWLNRVRENLGQLLIPSHFKPSAANGAPIHLLRFDKSMRPARAQGASLITHVAIFAMLIFLLTRPNGPDRTHLAGYTPLPPVPFPRSIFHTLANANTDGGRGSGGAQNPIPATGGAAPQRSLLVLVKPTIPQNQEHVLPEAPTIFDTAATPPPSSGRVGLPWMTTETNSGGPGKGHTMGSAGGPDVGDGGTGPFGDGTGVGKYGPGMTPPACAFCPYPTYTDEARHGKVQGAVELVVLVGVDGRAQDVRVVKGIGFGLDERAVETVRGWKFVPARDEAKRTVAAWVTVEAVFRLF